MAKKKEEYICEKNVTLIRDLNPPQLLTAEQIKAGRALLGWSQADLATKSGYSLPAINNIERGIACARPDTLCDIRQTFEQNGIQFIDGPGVRIENAFFRIKVLEGAGAVERLFGNILHALEKEGDEVLFFDIDEQKLLQFAHKELTSFQKKLALRNIRLRMLCRPQMDAGIKFINSEKRFIGRDTMPLSPRIIYSNRVAQVFFENPFRVIVLTHNGNADMARAQFDFLWNPR